MSGSMVSGKSVKGALYKQRLGYGLGDFACNLIWQVISLYLLYFYTDIMKLNATSIAAMFVVCRVIDGVTDLLVGYAIDKTRTRWGKSRPWFLFGAVPFALAAFLAFSVPDISPDGKLVYAYVTYIFLSFMYTVVNIPLASILPALTDDMNERTVPFLAKRMGKRNLYSASAGVQLAGLVIILIANLQTTGIICGAFITALGYGIKESIYFSMQADPVDYGEWKTGIQAAGTLSSVNGFLGKVAQAAAGGISGLLLAWGKYDSAAAVQTTEALTAIKAMYIYIPLILLICSLVTMAFYHLDKQFPEIQAELEQRRAAKKQ